MKRLLLILIVISAIDARAQFQGDLFFETPTTRVESDGEFELLVQAFVGSEAFGASHFEVLFDPSVIEITGVADGDFSTKVLCVDGGVASIIVANDVALDRPIGTVSVVRLAGRAVGTVGESSNLTIRPVELRNTDGDLLPDIRGFAATITIDPAPLASPGIVVRQVVESPSDEQINPERDPGLPYRPVGCSVWVTHRTSDGDLCLVETLIVDPGGSESEAQAPLDTFRLDLSQRPADGPVYRLGPFATGGGGMPKFLLEFTGREASLWELERSPDNQVWRGTGLVVDGDLSSTILIEERTRTGAFYRLKRIGAESP